MSSWMFMYLSGAEALQVLTEMVRVTKAGGEIRICNGARVVNPEDPWGISDEVVIELNNSAPHGKVIERLPNPEILLPGKGGLQIFRVRKKPADNCIVQ